MRIPLIILIVVVLVICGLAGFWFYAAGQVEATLDKIIAREAAQGRQWSCPDRTVSGFPLAIRVHCDRPTYAGLVSDEKATLSLRALDVEATLLDPFHASADLTAPFTYRSADDQANFNIAWDAMHVTLGGLPRTVDIINLQGTKIAAKGTFWSQDVQTHGAGRADITLHLAKDDAADRALEFKIDLQGAREPVLDDFLDGSAADSAILLSGRIAKPVFVNAPAPQVLELWRQNGGAITFWQARASHGPMNVEASGPLHLDGAHRVAGHLDARFNGLGPVLKRYGIDPNLAKVGGLISSLLKPRSTPAPTPSSADEIRLPVDFRDGRLAIGPIVTPLALAPLY